MKRSSAEGQGWRSERGPPRGAQGLLPKTRKDFGPTAVSAKGGWTHVPAEATLAPLVSHSKLSDC